MSSFTNLLIGVFMLQLCLITLGIATFPGSTLYSLATNPSNWSQDTFKNLLSDAFLAVGGALVIVGLIFFKSDFVVFAGFTSVIFSFGQGLMELHSQISAQLNGTVANFIVGPIILIYIFTLISWWRGRSG